MLADIIVMERESTLEYFINAVRFFKEHRIDLYEEYIQKMYSEYKKTEQARQEFRNKYGY